jgi:hypothetical protein
VRASRLPNVLAAALAAGGAVAGLVRADPSDKSAPVGRFAEEVDVQAPPVLFHFSFDDEVPVTGPDTIAVVEHARGRVRLSREMVRSGWRSLLLSDIAGDGDFPELQAFFPVRRAGRLTLSFALLVVEPQEELNVALAGPGGFGLGRDGISLWLATRDGWLTHVTDSIPRRLAELRPFVWYGVEVVYDLAPGTYSIRLFEEGRDQPIVALDRQPNAASAPGSALSVVSFIGDNRDDLSNVVYFVDDVLLFSDPAPALPPFVAPGRRRLFVEVLEGYREPLGAAPSCPPALSVEELGLAPDERGATGVAELLAAATGTLGILRPDSSTARARELEAARRWREGCAALARADFAFAERELRAALQASDGAFLYRASLAVALLGAERHDEARDLVAQLVAERPDDPRVATLSARLASAGGFAGEAEAWLRDAVANAASPALLEVTTAGAFHWLMRERRAAEAESFAILMEKRLAAAEAAGERARWTERRGDAAFAAEEPRRAGELYRQARALDPARSAALDLKLADVAFVLGDLDAERELRERIYGRLREAE